MNTAARVADQLDLSTSQVQSALNLLDDGNTVPFVARYRKDATGDLDEVQLRDIQDEAAALRELESRRESILETIREQDELTDELESAIREADTMARLEDLYAPYRPKRRTKGAKAMEAGLQPVAEAIRESRDFRSVAGQHTCEEYPTTDEVVEGAQHILAEEVADEPDVRDFVRRRLQNDGQLVCRRRRGADDDPKFEIYHDFSRPLDALKPHQVLAIRRGENEKELSAGVEADHDAIVGRIQNQYNDAHGAAATLYDEAIEDGYERLLHPRIEREIRSELEDEADDHAISVFSVNLKNLLLQAPLPDRTVLGVDPGYRTGCKVTLVDATGQLQTTGQIFVHDDRKSDAKDKLRDWIDNGDVDVVAVGNGTASRETEEVVAEVVGGFEQRDVAYAVVDEAGASVYSASEVARREFPDLDVSYRGAVSIARRLQDPLAELVKIDPKSIGVGMYQHDVDQNRLADSLDAVVEDVVNSVGIDLNSASRSLLARVSGIGPTLAGRIVAHRDKQGRFKRRSELRDVRGIGSKTYRQAAGFLRIRDGDEPLDNTAIHPETYPLARSLLEAADAELGSPDLEARLQKLEDSGRIEKLADRHDVGELALQDIVDALVEPGRDPRDAVDPPQLRSDVLTIDDLHDGMKLTGTIRNVVDFGAFVDIGVKEDGLIHISEMADRYVENPHAIVGVGDQVDVVVQSVDEDRGRIGLSMKAAR